MSMLSCQFGSRSLTAVLMVVSFVLSAGLQAADQAANPAAEPAAAKPANEPAGEPAVQAAEEAADYEVMPVPGWALGDTPQDKKRRNDLDVRKEGILRGSEPFDSQETKDYLQSYYTRYYFPLLTNPKHIGDWPDFRVKILRALFCHRLAGSSLAPGTRLPGGHDASGHDPPDQGQLPSGGAL